MTRQSIHINQRIPLDALYVALDGYLKDAYDEGYILEQLRMDFSGENRLKKSIGIINRIILKNPLNDFMLAHKLEILNACKRQGDRNLILIALLTSAFPFAFEVLQTFGKYLSVQEVVNTETILKSLSNVYGGNRATSNGLYSVIPMLVEANIITRKKPGIYIKSNHDESSSETSWKIFNALFENKAPFNNTKNGIYHLLRIEVG